MAVRDAYGRLLAERDQIAAKLAENTAALKDCVAAGRLFGVEISLEPDLFSPVSPLNLNRPLVSMAEEIGDELGAQSIREMTLELLRAAGEKGSKASPIRRTIQSSLGRQLHYKTVGMTLYRLGEKGLVRREGFVWFITPEGMKA